MRYIVAIGDVHGEFATLADLMVAAADYMDSIGAEHGRDYQYLFLGDYIDRGPDSAKVVDFVRRMEGRGAICLRGNHEQMLVDARYQLTQFMSRYGSIGSVRNDFTVNGGRATIESYGGKHMEGEKWQRFMADIQWMAGLPHQHETELHYFVHAGIMPGTPLASQENHVKLWVREQFLRDTEPHEKYVVHGHTPTLYTTGKPEVEVWDNRCNLDTGCGKAGRLSAGVFDLTEQKPIKTITAGPMARTIDEILAETRARIRDA